MKSVGRKLVVLFLTLACLITGPVSPFIGMNHPANVQAKQQHTSKEVTEKIIGKTETATIYDMGGGKKRAEIYPQKVRYKEESGEFADYDTSLKKVKKQKTNAGTDLSDYAYQTKQSGQPAYFPQELSQKTPVITENGTYQVHIIPQTSEQRTGTSTIKPKQEKVTDLYEQTSQKVTSVQYENVLEKATLQYEAETNGLKESILLDDASAGSEYYFQLQLKNCVIVTQEALTRTKVTVEKEFTTANGEALYLYDTKKDKLIGGIPAAFMVDASGDYSDACTYELHQKKTQKNKNDTLYTYDMMLRADETYLTAPERSYPVTIDPTISWNDCSSSAYVCRTAATTSYTNGNILCVGKRDTAADVCRAYIKFEGINTLLKNKTVTGVRLRLNTYGATTGMPVYVRRVTSSWNPKSVTYNSQPAKASGTMGSFTTTSSSQQITMSLPAADINSAVANGSWHGIEVTDSTGDTNTTSANRVWIYNEVYINGDKIPKLEVVYTDKTTLDLPELAYNVYGKNSGWSDYAFDGETAGTLSADNSINGFSMELNTGGFYINKVKYRGYFDKSGWSDWKDENATVRMSKNGDTLKSIQISAYSSNGETSSDYSVFYRVYVKNKGWLGWAKDGEEAGDYTSESTILGIQAMLVPTLLFKQDYIINGAAIIGEHDYYHSSKTPNLPIGNGAKLYGIGVRFWDSNLSKYHTVNTVVYKVSGNTAQGNSAPAAYFQMIGGDTNDCIVGFRMQFSDGKMSDRYEIEHMGAASGYSEEAWKENTSLTGTTSGNRVLEMMSCRIVPRGYEEGAKACLSDNFVFSEDGYSFANSKRLFGYTNYNPITVDKISAVVEDKNKAQEIYDKGWSGNCFGMALSSQLFSSGVWNINHYKGNIDASAMSVSGLYKQVQRKSQTLTDLIEYTQISQYLYSYNFGATYTSTQNNVSALVDRLKNIGNSRYMLMLIKGPNSHVVIPLGIEDMGDNNYKIRVYDVNHPMKEYYATCNTRDNSFSYAPPDSITYSSAALTDVGELLSMYGQKYNKIASLAKGVSSYSIKSQQPVDTEYHWITVTDCDTCTIVDENGKDIRNRDDVKILPSWDDNNYVVYQVPEGKYEIYADEVIKPVRIGILDYEVGVRYSISDNSKIEVEFHENKQINTAVSFLDKEAHEVTVYTYDRNKNGKYDTLQGKRIQLNRIPEQRAEKQE